MHFRTRAIHVGNERDPETGAVVPPVHFASTFVQPNAGEWGQYDYSRSGNPTRAHFEETMASLEEGAGGLAFASGMAAIHAVIMLLEPGDEVLAGADIYGGTYRLLHQVTRRFGIGIQLVDTTNLDLVAEKWTDKTKLLWLETPGNPLLTITDLESCVRLAHERGALVGVDNTFASPVLTRPLSLGVDVVAHSATKYIGGHSDVLGGVLVARETPILDRLYFFQNATGGVMSPMDSFLASRGLKTLELRVHEHCRSAMKIAEYLDDHPSVRQVHYPGLPDHPGHELAARQMNGMFGGMLSFELDGDREATRRVVKATRLFQLAVSLGAVESLIEHPATMSHASYAPSDRRKAGIVDSLVRLSVGLEHVDDLLEDLDQAFRQA